MNLLEVAGAFSLGLAVIFIIRLWRTDSPNFEVKVFTSITAAVIGAGLLLVIGSVTSHTTAWHPAFWFYPAGLAIGLTLSNVLWRKTGDTHDQFNFKIAVFGLMIIGLLLLIFSDRLPTKPLIDIARSLGEAIFIATVLAATVDLYIKQRTYREISVDIFKFLIGYGLPDEFKNRIRELVTTSDLIRESCTITWTLGPVSGQPDDIKLGYTVVYTLSNISDRAVPYQFRTSQGDETVDTRIKRLWGSSTNHDGDYEMTGDAIIPQPPDETGRRFIKGKAFSVPAENVRHGLRYTVGAEYETTLHSQQFDYHVFLAPTLGATVTVKHPANFTVYMSPRGEPHPGTLESTWEYKRLFFTDDAIFIRWIRTQT
jgi:hypothetical protein